MSDADIEREYEERLQAAARYLEVWVTFPETKPRKVRTFMDTPEGRGVAAKVADEWAELPPGPTVEVRPVPVGAGAERGGADLAPVAAHGTSADATARPVPTRACQAGARLCEVRIVAKPSGRRLVHGLECPTSPGEPISIRDEYPKGRMWPPRGVVRR